MEGLVIYTSADQFLSLPFFFFFLHGLPFAVTLHVRILFHWFFNTGVIHQAVTTACQSSASAVGHRGKRPCHCNVSQLSDYLLTVPGWSACLQTRWNSSETMATSLFCVPAVQQCASGARVVGMPASKMEQFRNSCFASILLTSPKAD